MAIPLPDSLRLARDTKSEKDLYDKARTWLTKDQRTPGIHASSLLDPRLAFFRHGKTETLEDRMVCTFLIGKVLHAFILSAANGATGTDWSTDEGSKTSEYLGIQYSVDRLEGKVPVEFKTSRKPFEPRIVADIDTYLQQALVYMAAEDSVIGKVWVLFTGLKEKNATTPAFRCYTVTVTREDLHKVREFIKDQVADLTDVIEKKKSLTVLPLCAAFKCGPKNCEFWEQCKPEGRYPLKTRKAWKA